jgi:hypothetical protein
MPEEKLEKAEYYRDLARALEKQAQAASLDSTRQDLLNLAASWLEMARRADVQNKGQP